MMLMAIDHCAYFVARAHPSEFWGVALPQHASWLSFMEYASVEDAMTGIENTIRMEHG